MEYEVGGDKPAAVCPYCDRPFTDERYATVHIGWAHADVATDDELERFESAREDEEYELFTFHVKAAVSVFLVYFLFTFTYALVWAD